MSNFQQTVDLRSPPERKKPAPKKNAAPIEKLYDPGPGEKMATDLQKINQPRAGEAAGLFRLIVLVLAIAVVGGTVYFMFFERPSNADDSKKTKNWYAVKLIEGTIYYGRIVDPKMDPVAIANVYYNYDQAKQEKDETKTAEERGNIRLVKRGKETQGGDGSMLIYQKNILLLEPLRADSKVLQAILEYEK